MRGDVYIVDVRRVILCPLKPMTHGVSVTRIPLLYRHRGRASASSALDQTSQANEPHHLGQTARLVVPSFMGPIHDSMCPQSVRPFPSVSYLVQPSSCVLRSVNARPQRGGMQSQRRPWPTSAYLCLPFTFVHGIQR